MTETERKRRPRKPRPTTERVISKRSHPRPSDKMQMQIWARQLLQDGRFYIVDTETTGLAKEDEIIQLGVIDDRGDTVMNTLLRPQRTVHPRAARVHGYSNEKLADAPVFLDIYIQLSTLFAGSVLIAYNMDFDWRLIMQTATRYGLPNLRPVRRECAMRNYARFHGDWDAYHNQYRFQKLAAAVKQIGMTPSADAHDALADCLMTLSLIEGMAK